MFRRPIGLQDAAPFGSVLAIVRDPGIGRRRSDRMTQSRGHKCPSPPRSNRLSNSQQRWRLERPVRDRFPRCRYRRPASPVVPARWRCDPARMPGPKHDPVSVALQPHLTNCLEAGAGEGSFVHIFHSSVLDLRLPSEIFLKEVPEACHSAREQQSRCG